MSRTHLKILAVLLSCAIVIVAFNTFDRLPSGVRKQIDSERAALATAQHRISLAHNNVTREEQDNPALFRETPVTNDWNAKFAVANSGIETARRDLDQLTDIEQHGHHKDTDRAQALINEARKQREAAVNEATSVETAASQWIDRAHHLPAVAAEMQRDYDAIHNFNLAPVQSTIQRAGADWPDKKSNLEARLASLTGIVTQSDNLWQSTAKARAEAAAGPPADFNTGEFLTQADQLKTNAALLPQRATELQSLAGQLYNSWDKILVDMDVRGRGSDRAFQQKIRTISTHFPNAVAKDGTTTSDENWVQVSQATYDSMRSNLGMSVEHKSAGEYDSEATHVPQPAGFAYIAPPSQESNRYGYWEHRNGESFWVFYGQYALLRDLLFNHSYRPLPRYDWDQYRDYRERGQTYYGRDFQTGGQKYGTGGTTTAERYSGSRYAQSGGFKDSEYASKSGSYRNSPYATPSARTPGGDSSPRRFGTSRAPEPEHSFHAPRPSPSFGGGRRFGGRRR